ncbi:SUKH superfamily protein [Tenacibaculum sp. 190524A05c]|uniref:SMI1/KNR4 family protein n=1 Tax=Tenacibaculum platacis TaxID=3137852 RepID=UPI0031FB281E
MEFENTKEAIALEDLNKFESEYKVLLPESYKNHLLKYNGGTPSKKYYKGVRVAFFNPIKYGGDTVEDVLEDLEDILPDNYLPIAYDPGDNQICLNLNEGNEYGYIYYLAMDLGEPSVEFLATSLEEMLNGLEESNNF